ncbi:ubiquitin-conjugating enzyme subfamily protein [Cardiosporidium cionae]|uniref:Ubiquitin-conjugating enzyme subfamily protein n=1 Tax=Cardiosporidium cionae TaxID=476202 RepID=A0ABQ7J8N7_9APIC|nr:ubiquitin-conjugating enzyme subfamily protein [Cardiosporidium cionae]|eukprot:KAF8820359.1 ubiquitin-conjugating enzyme subfamily protein [Cardiosporidium cionae]
MEKTSNTTRAPREVYRLRKELQDTQCLPEAEIYVHTVENDLHRWKGYIKGPDGTPYEGGRFVLDVAIPQRYPYTPPKIKFLTKIWHPNISSQTGAICLDILQAEWSPAITIRTALLSIQALLAAPEPDSPQDAEVAKMYKRSIQEFNITASTWTNTFARKNMESREEKIKKITEMGFSEEQAEDALTKHNWDETVALNTLLEGS